MLQAAGNTVAPNLRSSFTCRNTPPGDHGTSRRKQ